jgi:hypothetical protein
MVQTYARGSVVDVLDDERAERAGPDRFDERRDARGIQERHVQALLPGPPVPSAAWAAASRAIGTRYGEHDT